MLNQIEQGLPEQWRGVFHMAMAPIAWLFPFQKLLLSGALSSEAPVLMALKLFFLCLPALCIVVGLWCSMVSVYTLPFRSHRIRFVSTLFVLWWDVARAGWLFWAGMAKFFFLALGAVWGLMRFVVAAAQEFIISVFELPGKLGGNISRNFLQGGIPWIAVLLTVMWAVLEALIFSYILAPTISEILSNLTGSESHRYLGIFMFVMLTPMILGSFACMHVLVEAVKSRNVTQIVQMLFVEVLVMGFEVMFFYRELVDSLTPWISQQTGVQMGLVPVLVIATCGWIGVRGMTWFLFARYGTPTLLAFISRQRVEESAQPGATKAAPMENRWEKALQRLKQEQGWFQEKAQTLLEAAILPAFQIIAAGINFCMLLFLSRPLFNLPFKNLAEVGETKALLQQVETMWRPS